LSRHRALAPSFSTPHSRRSRAPSSLAHNQFPPVPLTRADREPLVIHRSRCIRRPPKLLPARCRDARDKRSWLTPVITCPMTDLPNPTHVGIFHVSPSTAHTVSHPNPSQGGGRVHELQGPPTELCRAHVARGHLSLGHPPMWRPDTSQGSRPIHERQGPPLKLRHPRGVRGRRGRGRHQFLWSHFLGGLGGNLWHSAWEHFHGRASPSTSGKGHLQSFAIPVVREVGVFEVVISFHGRTFWVG
jgi:hypothetical protein